MPAWTMILCLSVWLTCFVIQTVTKVLSKMRFLTGEPPQTSRTPVYWQRELKFALIRGLESNDLEAFESVPLEVESFFSRGELKAFSDALITHGTIERGLFWDLAYRQRLAKVNELNVASLLDRVDEVEDGLLSSWLSNVLMLLEPTAPTRALFGPGAASPL